MATGNNKKQKKMKQKEYLVLINSPNNVEKWLANTSVNNSKSSSPEEPKQFKVNQKEYKQFLDQPKFTGMSHVEKSDSLTKKTEQTKTLTSGQKKPLKVKQKDLLEVINVSNLSNEKIADKMLHEKASMQKRYIFTDGFETTDHDEPRKRIVFDPQKKYDVNRKPHAEVKRYHSPQEVSKVLEKCSSPLNGMKKHARNRLEEENPVDFGSMVKDRLFSIKKSSKEASSIKRNKVPLFNGNSKNYDLVKEQKSFNKKQLSFSGGTHSQSEEEIFISLDRKSPREKNNLIYETMPEILSPSVENDSLSERKFSIDGAHASSGNSSQDFSKLNNKEEMLF